MTNFADGYRILLILFVLILHPFLSSGQTRVDDASQSHQQAEIELNAGVNAYKTSDNDGAILHFENALKLQPDLNIAKLYLGVALSNNVIPGVTTTENLNTAQRAIGLLKEYLATNPSYIPTMKIIASVYYNVKEKAEAREWQKKILTNDPKDYEAAYTIGVIDWEEAHQNSLTELDKINMTDDGKGNARAPESTILKIREKNSALVEEAILYLNQAIENQPNYDDAMSYMNLIYRRKADLDWGNEIARKRDVAEAEAWMQKAMSAHKLNAEKNDKTTSTRPKN